MMRSWPWPKKRELALWAAPLRGSRAALLGPSGYSSAQEPGEPPCVGARAARAVGGQLCRCQDTSRAGHYGPAAAKAMLPPLRPCCATSRSFSTRTRLLRSSVAGTSSGSERSSPRASCNKVSLEAGASELSNAKRSVTAQRGCGTTSASAATPSVPPAWHVASVGSHRSLPPQMIPSAPETVSLLSMPTDCATVRPSATEGSGRSGSAVASAVRIARRELESCKGSRMLPLSSASADDTQSLAIAAGSEQRPDRAASAGPSPWVYRGDVSKVTVHVR
eukprot:scaffold42332_cov63-Phaeocystis_antarctica.AAC.7